MDCIALIQKYYQNKKWQWFWCLPVSKKKKKPEFQNTEESTKTDQTKLDTINDVKLDSEYVKESESIDTEYTTTPEPELTPRHVNESESLDDPSKNIKDDSEEK